MDRLATSLTPELCVSTTSLRDFLRISRSLDDGITQQLNSLLAESKADFEPPSSLLKQPFRPSSKQLSHNTCQKFMHDVIFPSWYYRDKILQYCKSVATNMEINEAKSLPMKKDETEIIDERLDPYSSRSLPDETETHMLSNILRQENQVENIVRNRTLVVISERCGKDSKFWERSFTDWKRLQDGCDCEGKG